VPGGWQGATASFTDPSRTWQNRAYRFGAYALDRAGNVGTAFYISPNIYRLDTTPPTITATGFGTTVLNYLATTSQNFIINYTETTGTAGSPMASWAGNFTNHAGPWVVPISGVGVGYTLPFTANVRNVTNVVGDLNYSNGSRPYTARVTSLCDGAGNCASVGPGAPVIFNIFSNPNYAPVLSIVSSNLGNASNIADGTPRGITYSARDGYGNPIFPAPGIGRTLGHSFLYRNSMYLNQQSRSGGSSMRASVGSWPLESILPISNAGTGSISPISPISNALVDQYTVNLHAYTPTANSYTSNSFVSDPSAEFTLNWGRLDVTDPQFTSTSVTNSGIQSAVFGAPFTSNFSAGDLLAGQIIEGVVQSSTHRVQSQSSKPYTWYGLYFGFSGVNLSLFGGLSAADAQNQAITAITQFFWPTIAGDNQIWTRLVQNAGSTVSASNAAAISTHIGYAFDGVPAIINTHVLGKSSYFDTKIVDVATQVGIKIIGLTASDSANVDQLAAQFPQDVNLITGVKKSDTRNAIRKSVSAGIRGLRTAPVGSTLAASNLSSGSLPLGSDLNGTRLQKQNQDIYYLTNGSRDILELSESNSSNTLTVTGQKTIVTEGINIYIRSNLSYGNATSSLALVALKNANGEGGKIYIHPSVTNISAFIYADGAVLGYDGTTELGQTTSISILKNQLYIYGSVMAANTIGGSAAATPICPAYYASTACTREVAQKFDLNYLRRYFLVDASTVGWATGTFVPNGWARIIGGGTCNIAGVCTSVAGLTAKFTTTSANLAKYPVIVEYDPNILKNPPPLISIVK
jgi:hypothetical protein